MLFRFGRQENDKEIRTGIIYLEGETAVRKVLIGGTGIGCTPPLQRYVHTFSIDYWLLTLAIALL